MLRFPRVSVAMLSMSATFVLAIALAPLSARAQGTLDDYRRAASINTRFAGLTIGVAQNETWIGATHQAVYRVSVTGGNRFVRVDADQWSKQPAFDHSAVARSMSAATGQQYTEITLPFATITMVDNGTAFEGDAAGARYRCVIATSSCARAADAANGGRGGRAGGAGSGGGRNAPRCAGETAPAPGEPRTEIWSPNCATIAFVQNYNVAIKPAPVPNAESGRGGNGASSASPNYTLLSTDGSEADKYLASSIEWSPDSKKLVAYRQKPGYSRVPYYIQSSPSDQVQPKLVPYGQAPGNFGGGVYRKAGDVLDSNQPALFDIESKRQLLIDRSLFPNPYAISRPVWRKDGAAYAFQYNQRGHMVYRVLEVDATTGTVRPMIDEVTKSFFMYSDAGHNVLYDVGAGCRLTQGGGCDGYAGGELIWASERDGWNHLYLFDGTTGRVKNQITKGEWVVRGVDSVDVANRQIYFRASGMNTKQDPYFVHYYRINFDGTGLVAYTEADGTHTVTWSSDRQYYLDAYSRVDLPTVIELKRASDQRVLALEKGDMSAAVKAGFRPPEVFVAKGRDGRTDIWGIVVRPVTFDAKKKYPVIEQIYAGPHDSFVPKTWGGGQGLMALAEIGFVVVQIDGMGTSNRGKIFHDVAWKNIADAGFADRILWHQAVNKQYAWYDISRVGIYGTSAGGQNAAGAVFFHPEFYKVAVANSGCHDNRMDKIWWNEAWMGEIGPHYEANSNVTAAKNLKGRLYLTVGEMDTNVDPSSTMQVANALIAAGKDFDLLVVPNGGHGATGPDGTRRRNDFFVRWLYGIAPPDWNSGISLRAPSASTGTPATRSGGSTGDFEFPHDDALPRSFFDEDPSFSSIVAWWY